MLHAIAFIVIGIVVAYSFARGATGKGLILRLVATVVASGVTGAIVLFAFGQTSVAGKFGSLLVALVFSFIVALLLPQATSTTPAPAPATPTTKE